MQENDFIWMFLVAWAIIVVGAVVVLVYAWRGRHSGWGE